MKLYPKCVAFKEVAYTAQGHLLPCCWLDGDLQNFKQEDAYAQFVSLVVDEEEFNVSNWLDSLDLEVHD